MIQTFLFTLVSTLFTAIVHCGSPVSLFRWTDSSGKMEKAYDIYLYMLWLYLCLMPIIAQVGHALSNNQPTYLPMILLIYLPVYMVTLLQFKYRVSFYKP